MRILISVLIIGFAAQMPTLSLARELTFDEAIDIAVNHSSRGQIIRGDREVAERTYFAKKVGFWVPEISIRGSIPGYEVNETYSYLPGTDTKTTGQRTTIDWESYINFDQNLITGGKLTFRAYLRRNDWVYPQLDRINDLLVTVDEDRNLGSFDLTLDQPILKPSEPKYELSNKKDDLEIARLTHQEDIATVKQEVAEAYFGVLQLTLHQQMAADRLESARLQTGIDSIKFAEEVLSEEAWLESVSARLDAELEQFDVESNLAAQRRELAILLDLESITDIEVSAPDVAAMIDSATAGRLLANTQAAIPVLKAHHEFRKADRAARYEASSRGLTGTLSANFGKEKGRVETSLQGTDDLNLNDWGINLQFNYPIWDGGVSGASVKAAELAAEKARIEYESAQKASHSEIENLINGIGVSLRKLQVLQQQINLARNRLNIALSRFEDGQISRIKYLEDSAEYLQAENSYYEELKNYLIDTFRLEGKFSS
ncbi:MAG: TolC family protein [candidate division Zixibacteria bacterium]|nr:TolC family protein [candidate division Zixibacteria bacterium]